MKLFRRRRPESTIDPGTPHEFRQIDDPGLAAYSSGGGAAERWSPAAVVMTDNFIRKSRCGVPGCGHERHDPIHTAPED